MQTTLLPAMPAEADLLTLLDSLPRARRQSCLHALLNLSYVVPSYYLTVKMAEQACGPMGRTRKSHGRPRVIDVYVNTEVESENNMLRLYQSMPGERAREWLRNMLINNFCKMRDGSAPGYPVPLALSAPPTSTNPQPAETPLVAKFDAPKTDKPQPREPAPSVDRQTAMANVKKTAEKAAGDLFEVGQSADAALNAMFGRRSASPASGK